MVPGEASRSPPEFALPRAVGRRRDATNQAEIADSLLANRVDDKVV